MKRIIHRLSQCFTRSPRLPNIIIVGIDTPSYRFASALKNAQLAHIVAFIDDEPWSNRTDLLGATVRYPSDLKALIEKYNVTGVVEFGESPLLLPSLRKELIGLRFAYVQLAPKASPEQWLDHFKRSI